MKNFTNCTGEEFMAQAVKFRAPFVAWLKAVNASEIYHKTQGNIPEDATEEQVATAFNDFVGEIEAAALECRELTMQVLRIATFNEDDSEPYTFPEYQKAALEMYLNRDVRGFFVRVLKSSLTTSSEE